MERISSHPDPFVDIIHPRSQAAREAKTMIKLFAITLALGSMVALAGAQQTAPTPPTAAVAKKCRELAIKAYPPKLAGSTKTGTAQEERDYFAQCIRNGGNMDGNVKKGDDAK